MGPVLLPGAIWQPLELGQQGLAGIWKAKPFLPEQRLVLFQMVKLPNQSVCLLGARNLLLQLSRRSLSNNSQIPRRPPGKNLVLVDLHSYLGRYRLRLPSGTKGNRGVLPTTINIPKYSIRLP